MFLTVVFIADALFHLLGSAPSERPSFASIVDSLKKLVKSPAELIKMGDA